MYSPHRSIFTTIVFGFITALIVVMQAAFVVADRAAVATNFEECVQLGNPIMEVSPRQCHSGHKTFTEEGVSPANNLTLL